MSQLRTAEEILNEVRDTHPFLSYRDQYTLAINTARRELLDYVAQNAKVKTVYSKKVGRERIYDNPIIAAQYRRDYENDSAYSITSVDKQTIKQIKGELK